MENTLLVGIDIEITANSIYGYIPAIGLYAKHAGKTVLKKLYCMRPSSLYDDTFMTRTASSTVSTTTRNDLRSYFGCEFIRYFDDESKSATKFWLEHIEVFKSFQEKMSDPRLVLKEFYDDLMKLYEAYKYGNITIVTDCPQLDIERVNIKLRNYYPDIIYGIQYHGNRRIFSIDPEYIMNAISINNYSVYSSDKSDQKKILIHDHSPDNDAEYIVEAYDQYKNIVHCIIIEDPVIPPEHQV